jgi:hypothetical protein
MLILLMKLEWFILLAALVAALGSRRPDKGLNLPPTQATTRDGAFFPGLLSYEYHPNQVTRATDHAGFNAIRLAVNVETANDMEALQRHKTYIDAAGGRGVICMFDTSSAPGTSWPRTGRITGKVTQIAEAWRKVHSVFAPYGENVMYELFNEPWGYQSDAVTYVADMMQVVKLAKLPTDRVIVAGLYGSADVQSVARAGWPGYLAYHCYSFWLPEGKRTRDRFAEKIKQDLAGLSSRVFITEFGVGLDGLKVNIDVDEEQQDVARYHDQYTSDWQREHTEGKVDLRSICAQHPDNKWCKKRGMHATALAQGPTNMGADVVAQMGGESTTAAAPLAHQEETLAFLRGLRDAILTFNRQKVGLRGLYHWHGWHNGDTWDFWDAANARSSRMIQMMMVDLAEGATVAASDASGESDAYLSQDFVNDEQSVHMMLVRQLGPEVLAECPAECSVKSCQAGNAAQIGGRHTTGNFCTHNCSMPFNGMRFCGVGGDYSAPGAVDCSACARPAMCAGLPCWSEEPASLVKSVGNMTASRGKFLHALGNL